jgi:hypothetical protein
MKAIPNLTQKKIGVIFILSVLSVAVNAQGYDAIEDAITIQQQEGWDSGPAAYTTVGASYAPPASNCYNMANRWFKFTATSSYLKITIYGGTISYIQYDLYSGSSYTPVTCNGAAVSTYTFERTDLAVGTTYYLAVSSDNNGKGSFGIKVSTVMDYDYVEGAITIQHLEGWDSGPEAYTTVGAIYQAPSSTCGNIPNRWFKFTATNTYMKMTVYGGTINIIKYDLYTGSSYTPVSCGQATAGQSTYIFEKTDLVIGNTYYLAVSSDNNGKGTFGLKISTIKDYDYVEGAIAIQHQNGWDSGPAAYTTVGAIYQAPASTCGNIANRWFKFRATDAHLKMTVYGGTIANIQYTLYAGSAYTQIGCGFAGGGISLYTFEKFGLTIGETYYIAIGSDNNGKGTFGLNMQSGNAAQGHWTVTNDAYLHPVNMGYKVAIGTNYVPESYTLAVSGNAILEKVKVQLTSSWPDYVFKTNYVLRDLPSVKEYISKQGHLPDVPSEEVVKNEGIDVSEMNAILLRKIEELTLYQIALEERIKQQEVRMMRLEQRKGKR